jgi:histidinol phosphatase-like PHP family hydrolase
VNVIVHTTWSDGRLSLREVVDLYGRTGRFDVIAITDHILMKRDLLARAGRFISLGRREFWATEERFAGYLDDIAAEAKRARNLYDPLVLPGAEITQNHIRSKKNSHTSPSTSTSTSARISRPRRSFARSAARTR